MFYTPLNYEQINVSAGTYTPSTVKAFNNETFAFWERALFQRACSVLKFNVPEDWKGNVKDFLLYCLFKYGYVAIFENNKFGLCFQPCTLNGYNFYYQPKEVIISNPLYSDTLEIGTQAELLKLTPDYVGIWDIISYYAEKLSSLDNAINMSIINNKLAYILAGNSKASVEALKKIMDKINQGDPAVFLDKSIVGDTKGEDPFTFIDRDLKKNYLTTDQLQDFQTLLNNFDNEIGIPTIPYQKKERLVTSEAESKIIDATSRSVVWFETLQSSIDICNRHFTDLNLSVELRYKPVQEGSVENE